MKKEHQNLKLIGLAILSLALQRCGGAIDSSLEPSSADVKNPGMYQVSPAEIAWCAANSLCVPFEYSSIEQAVYAAPPGSQILVMGGGEEVAGGDPAVYQEHVVIYGTDNITIQVMPGTGKVVLEANSVGGVTPPIISIKNSKGTIIDGFEFREGPSAIEIDGASTETIIQNNLFMNYADSAISMSVAYAGASNTEILSNEFHGEDIICALSDCRPTGLRLTGATLTVVGNKFYSFDVGIEAINGSDNVTVKDNLFSNFGYSAQAPNPTAVRWGGKDSSLDANTVQNFSIGIHLLEEATGNHVGCNTFQQTLQSHVDEGQGNTIDICPPPPAPRTKKVPLEVAPPEDGGPM